MQEILSEGKQLKKAWQENITNKCDLLYSNVIQIHSVIKSI